MNPSDHSNANPTKAALPLVVFVDDERAALESLELLTHRFRGQFERRFFSRVGEALPFVLAQQAPVVVVSDWMMQERSGLEFLSDLRDAERSTQRPRNHFILLTGRRGAADCATGLDAGADDYLVKPCEPTELLARVRVGFRLLAAEEAMRCAYRELELVATTDHLTGLWNRRRMLEVLALESSRGTRGLQEWAVILLDLDHFKRVNDRHGHDAGDAVLVEAARRLRSSVRPYDSVGRWGGEEFLVCCPGVGSETAAVVAERIRARLAELPIELPGGGALDVTASLGTATCALGGTLTVAELLQAADRALYQAKSEGRNRVCAAVFPGCSDGAEGRLGP